MDKILFIVPPHIKFEDFINPAFNTRIIKKKGGNFGSVLTDMPLGVLSLSSYVKKYKEIDTKLIDFNVNLNKIEKFDFLNFLEYFKDYLSKEEIINYSPDIIGISALFTPSYQNFIDIAKCCREIFPKSLIIAGGGVPTNMYREIFRDCDSFDALCFGEGEKPLRDLLTSENKIKHLKENPSWITKEKIELNSVFKHDFILDLDEIPFYDYDICNTDDYGLNPAITAYASIGEKKQNFHVMTSRGCPYHCCFCSSHTVHGRKMRYFSINRVKKDFKLLRDKYHAKILVFQDDHFVANKKRALDIIEIVKELNLRAVFQNGLALYGLDRNMLEALKSAGVDQLLLSIESGSSRVLEEIMHKPLNLSIVKRVADDCRELGIYTNVNILIGLPGETKKDIEDARNFLKTINANWFLIFCATPLVGSEMFDICYKNNYLKSDYINFDFKKAVVETPDFSSEYIQEIAYDLNLYLNFVENSDYKLGNYEMALKGFENAIKAKNDHALAFYYAAKCYEKLGKKEKAEDYRDNVKKIAEENLFWKRYLEKFKIPYLEQ